MTLTHKFDVLLLTEIGDNANHFLSDDTIPGYRVFAIDVPTNNKYGGTAILIKNEAGTVTQRDDLKVKVTCQCSQCAVESSWVELDTGSNKYILSAIYRHCKGSVQHFNEQLDNSLQKLGKKTTAIIGGDTNINILNQEHEDTTDYITTFFSHNFIPQILTPTRITDDTATCIDHIFVRLPNNKMDDKVLSGNIISEIADHLPNFLCISKDVCRNTKDRPFVRLYGDKNIDRFKTLLEQSNWDEILKDEDIDIACTLFYRHILLLHSKSFPLVRVSIKKFKNKDWITPSLIKCTRNKDKLFKKQLKNPTEHNIQQYKRYRNILTTSLEIAENNYYQNKLSDRKEGVINFWKSFSHVLNPKKKTSRTHLDKLVINGRDITGDENISNAMNDFFCNIGKTIHDRIPNVVGSFTNYLKNSIKENFFLSAVTPAEVFKQITALNGKKACGPDTLKPALIKKCNGQLVKPLTILFNKSIQQAKYPTAFKLAKVIASHKKESRFLPSNYRPISLLNCFNKIFERLIYEQMMKFIDKHKILYINQYGFRKRFSTTQVLIDVFDLIKKAMDRKEYAIGIFLDLEKAFDTICHKILLSKLDYYGFRGHVNLFFKSYLSDRIQYTQINGKNSESRKISFGVPQGSILGPLFFLLFINDIHAAMTNCNGKLFADDTSLILNDKNILTLKTKAESAMKEIDKWFKLNKLSLSHGKSVFLLFHGPRVDPCRWFDTIQVERENIPRATTVKYVGLHVDEGLTFKKHVEEVYKSLVKFFSVFYNIRDKVNPHLVRTIYYACIHSKIKYGIEIYGTAKSSTLQKLQTIQNKLLKVLTKREYRFNTNTLHTSINILKVNDIHKHALLQFVYKSYIKKTIPNFENYFTTRGDQHGLNLRNNSDLDTVQFFREHGRSTVQRTGSFLWNQISEGTKASVSLDVFKNNLFKELSSKYTN